MTKKTASFSTIEDDEPWNRAVYCQECDDECDPTQQMCSRCKSNMWWDGSLVRKCTPIEKQPQTPENTPHITQLPVELSFSD